MTMLNLCHLFVIFLDVFDRYLTALNIFQFLLKLNVCPKEVTVVLFQNLVCCPHRQYFKASKHPHDIKALPKTDIA